MTSISKNFVSFYTVSDNDNAQRLDNFLLRYLKGVPKSHIHRIIRNGEIRIDKRRASADTRLITGQIIRIPPVRVAEKNLSGCLKIILICPLLPLIPLAIPPVKSIRYLFQGA